MLYRLPNMAVIQRVLSCKNIHLLPVVVIPIILFADLILSGKAFIWGLPSLQFVPWMSLAWSSIQDGVFPFWNPYNGFGAPLFANYQLGLLYPPNYILGLLNALGGASWVAYGYSLLIVAHVIWTGMGMLRLMERLGANRLGQIIGALAFQLSGYLVGRAEFFSMVYAIAWLPWIIYAVDLISPVVLSKQTDGKVKNIGLLSLFLTFQLLAGHAQLTWYTIQIAFIYGGWSAYRHQKIRGLVKWLGIYLLAGGVAGLSASFQLIPTAEYLLESQRSSAYDPVNAMNYSFWPWRFFTLFAPDFFGNPADGNYWGYAAFWEDALYIGILPLMSAIGTIFLPENKRGWEGKNIILFFWVIIFISILLALGGNTPIFPFLFNHIPTFDMFQAPTRYMIWAEFSLSILAGIGISQWTPPSVNARKNWKRLIMSVVALAFAAGLTLVFLRAVKPTIGISIVAMSVLVILTIYLWKLIPEKNSSGYGFWKLLIVVFVGVDLLGAWWGYHQNVESSFYKTVFAEGMQVESTSEQSRIFMDSDLESMLKFGRFLRFGDFRPLEEWSHYRQFNLPNLNILNRQVMVNNFDPLLPARYAEWMEFSKETNQETLNRFLSMAGVNYYYQYDSYSPLGLKLTTIDQPLERYQWYSCAEQIPDKENIFSTVIQEASKGKNERCAVIESQAEETYEKPGSSASIQIADENPIKITLSVNAETDGWLVLADTWYPGWRAMMDGQIELPIERANFLFRAVKMPKGEHVVDFEYRPVWITPAILMSLLGCATLIILLLGDGKRLLKKIGAPHSNG